MTLTPAQHRQRKQASQNSPWRRQAACKTDNAIKSAMRIKANAKAREDRKP